MIKTLIIGDPHVQPNNLKESEALFSWVFGLAKERAVTKIIILGDLFHTHAVLRLEVIDFWTKTLKELASICEVEVLVGNHDQAGDYHSGLHALSTFKEMGIKNLKIFDRPSRRGPFGYIPYIHKKEDFISAAQGVAELGAKILFCHQTYDGSKFENGTYAPDGIDPKDVPFPLIIGGHIHAQQEFGKVWLPGTPRWLTSSDANQPKGIWAVDFDKDSGKILGREFLSSEEVCEPIVEFDFREGSEMPKFSEGARVKINLIGSSDWVSKRKKELFGKVAITTKITDRIKLESRKVCSNFEEFVEKSYQTKVDKKKLIAYMKEKGLV